MDTTDLDVVRDAFEEAGAFLVASVESVPEAAWDAPGLGEWTVRELAVHASRAATSVAQYLEEGRGLTGDDASGDSVAYYTTVLAGDDVHRTVAERSRSQAAELDEDVGDYVRRVVAEAVGAVRRAAGTDVVVTPAGPMTLAAYLPSRVVELVVHGIDLCDAVGLQARPPDSAMAVTVRTLTEVALRRPGAADPAALFRALTGRAPLPGDTDVFR